MKAMPACELEHHSLSLRHQGDAHVSGLSKFMDFMIAFRICFGNRGLMCTYRIIWNRFYCATLYASVAPRIYDLESCRSIQVTSNRNFWIPHFFFSSKCAKRYSAQYPLPHSHLRYCIQRNRTMVRNKTCIAPQTPTCHPVGRRRPSLDLALLPWDSG